MNLILSYWVPASKVARHKAAARNPLQISIFRQISSPTNAFCKIIQEGKVKSWRCKVAARSPLKIWAFRQAPHPYNAFIKLWASQLRDRAHPLKLFQYNLSWKRSGRPGCAPSFDTVTKLFTSIKQRRGALILVKKNGINPPMHPELHGQHSELIAWHSWRISSSTPPGWPTQNMTRTWLTPPHSWCLQKGTVNEFWIQRLEAK
jgi:hypothetical protein